MNNSTASEPRTLRRRCRPPCRPDICHEGGNLENPWNEHKKDIHVLSVEPEDAPDEVTYVTISFDKGIPVAIDDQEMGPVEILTKLNELGSKNGVGTIDIIENRLVGMLLR